MKRIIFFLFIFASCFLFFVPHIIASELCSKEGYTVVTINGIFTDKKGAILNRDNLKKNLLPTFNNQPLTIDFLYNPTHLAGAMDLVDVVAQAVIDKNDDYDMDEILNDASKKVKTKKVLLVGHSQGTFYTNNLYDSVTSKKVGVSPKSIGVYNVATPADRVAGEGKYLTSDTDTVINSTKLKILIAPLAPNIHIPLKSGDDPKGHSFSDVYLKYQANRIVSDVKLMLSLLKNDEGRNTDTPCIPPLELTLMHKAQGAAFAVADPMAVYTKAGLVNLYNTSSYIADASFNLGSKIGSIIHNSALAIGNAFSGLFANVAASLPEDTSTLTTLTPDTLNNDNNQNNADNPGPVTEPVVEEIIQETETNTDAQNIVENNSENIISTDQSQTEKAEVLLDGFQQNVPEQEKAEEATSNVSSTSQEEKIEYPNLLPGTGGKAASSNDVENGGGGGNPPASDTIAPVITLAGALSVDVEKDTVYTDAGATALDDIDGDLTSSIVKSGTFTDTATVGNYTIIYTVSDAAGNVSTKTRTVNVIAPPPPPLNTTIINTNTILTSGEYNYENLVVTNNAILTLESDPQSASAFKGVKINAVNITVDNGSSIVADGKGYTSGPGTPSGSDFYAGGSYGGVGDMNTTSPIYGSAKEPIDLGSGGADAFHGGGAIRLAVTNMLTNNGVISANGQVNASGGSIYITTDNISGSGSFSANGGDIHASSAVYRPGGGGRIALYYKASSFNGKAEALGGCGTPDGFTKICAGDGSVGFFDMLNNDLFIYSSWIFQKNDSPFNFRHIVLTNGAKVSGEETASITADDLLLDKISFFTLASNQSISIPFITIDTGSTFTLSDNEILTVNTLTVKGNSFVTVASEKKLSLSVSNINIEAGSSISANGKGYKQGNGPGAAMGSHFYAGASYGGLGWDNTPESIYGSETDPIDFGSSGTGVRTAGGGTIRLIITDTLSNDGVISANGDPTSSGGSIYVTTKNLAGNGLFSANGGSGECGNTCNGPGGGGRVAIYYEKSSFPAENIKALGSSNGDRTSGNGTVKIVDTSIPPPPPPDTTPPSVTSYTFNSVAGDITIDPTVNPLAIAITASENVNWMSIKLENQADPTIYKIFQSGSGCVDGTNTCSKTWDGTLSGGSPAPAGTYKIKLHMKDAANNEFYDYLTPYVINVSMAI